MTLEASHFDTLREGKVLAVNGFIIIPLWSLPEPYQMPDGVTVTNEASHRLYPHAFSASLAAMPMSDADNLYFVQAKKGRPKEIVEFLTYVRDACQEPWVMKRNCMFFFSNEADYAIAYTFLLS